MLLESSGWKTKTYYILGALLFLFYANFIFPFGSYKGLFYFCLLALLAKFAVDRNAVLDCLKSKSVEWYLGVPIFLLVLGILPFEWIDPGKKSMQNLLFFGFLFIATLLLLEGSNRKTIQRAKVVICTLFVAGIVYHFYGTIRVDTFAANFSNPHYAAQFCMTAAFVLSYYLLKEWRPATLVLWVICILMVGWVLINTLSRPAWFTLVFSIALTVLFVFKIRNQIFGLIALVVLSVALYFFLPDFFSSRIDDLIENFANEERVQIWADGMRMQFSDGLGGWIFGHGPGSYVKVFESYNTMDALFFFPHNFVMEILFESGLLGLVAVFCFFGKLYWDMWRLFVNEPTLKFEISTLFLCITTNLLFAFFTFPFYSKYVILYLIPFIAIVAHLFQRLGTDLSEEIEFSEKALS